jgi:hypothetical protein
MKTVKEIKEAIRSTREAWIKNKKLNSMPFFAPQDIPWDKLVPLEEYVWSIVCNECRDIIIHCKHRPGHYPTAEEAQKAQKALLEKNTMNTNTPNSPNDDTPKRRGRKSRLAQHVDKDVADNVYSDYKDGKSVMDLSKEYNIATTAIYEYLRKANVLRPRGRQKKTA